MGRSNRMSKKREDNLWNKAKNNPDIKRLIDKRLNNRMPIKEYEVTLHHMSVESYRTTIRASSKEEAEEIFSFLILGDDFYKDTYLEWHVEADIVESREFYKMTKTQDLIIDLTHQLKAIGFKQSEILKIKGEN